MKRDDARQQIMDMLGWSKSPEVSLKVDATLRFIQNELETEATLPFFLRKEDTEQVTNVNDNIIPRPNDFIRLWNEDPIRIVAGDGSITKLVQGPQSVLRLRFNGSSMPGGFTEVGEDFLMYPVPMDTYPLIFTYYANDDVLWANTENKWLKYLPGLLIGRVGFIIATGMRDPTAQQIFGGLAAAGTEKLNQMSTAQDESSGKPVIGGED